MSGELLNQVGMDQVADKARENGPAVDNVKPKVDVKGFLRRYRELGLPGAKKFRRKTRLAQLTGERDFYLDMVKRASRLTAQANNIIRELSKESNFAVHETVEGTPGVIEWIADDAALNEARRYLKSFNEAVSLPVQQQSQLAHPTHSQSVDA